MRCGYHVAKSPIHGFGVFASSAIRHGERIGVIRGLTTGRRCRRADRLYAIELDIGFLVPKGEPGGLWLLNHSCNPNATLLDKRHSADVIAICTIAAGCEITCDYRPSFHEGRLRCCCGTDVCSGRI